MANKDSFGEELLRLRLAAGLTQQQLADATGISRSFLTRLEVGARGKIGADILFAICEALNVKCEHFRPYLSKSTGHKTES